MKTYKDIFGWFDFEDIYDSMVSKADDGAVFVEVGAYLGKSTNYLANAIGNSGKKIELIVIDLFDEKGGLPEHLIPEFKRELSLYGSMYNIFKNNMKGLKYKSIKGDGIELAKDFKDNSIDFVFIDACKGYWDVRAMLDEWMPKVKGYIGMHDFNNVDWKTLKAGVTDWCNENGYEIWHSGNCPEIKINGCSFLTKAF